MHRIHLLHHEKSAASLQYTELGPNAKDNFVISRLTQTPNSSLLKNKPQTSWCCQEPNFEMSPPLPNAHWPVLASVKDPSSSSIDNTHLV